VILPCRAGSDASTQAYCDGLTDTLSARMTPLAASRGVQITSTLEVRRRGVKDAGEAHREFGATLVLEGGVLRVGDVVRVNYVAVDATTLKQVDAYSTTAAAGDVFVLQDRVATWAVGVLTLNLRANERQTLAARDQATPAAIELYLEGRGFLLDYQKPGNLDAAIDRFNRALAIDRRYALAHAGLGRAWWQKYEIAQDPQLADRARDACGQAAVLDPDLPASHMCLGTIALGSGAFENAVLEFGRAVEREPTNDEATVGLARAQARAGRPAEAESTYQRAVTIRPQYWATHVRLGAFYLERGRYAEAAQRYELATALAPDSARLYAVLCGVYVAISRPEEAIAACRRSTSLTPTMEAYSNWGAMLMRLRRFDEAVARLEEAKKIGPEFYRVTGNLARAYYFSGKRTEATTHYRRAIELAERRLALNPQDVDARISLAEYYAKLGQPQQAAAQMKRIPADLSDPHSLLLGAIVQAEVGDRNAALTWLERAAGRGLARPELQAWAELDALKTEPRFAALTQQ
jgi:tetratricopeptide (TPR) repeat protein/TolB-like protein